MTRFERLHDLLAEARATGVHEAAIDHVLTLGYSLARAQRACRKRPPKLTMETASLKTIERWNPGLARAIWSGDVERLEELAPCGCCCGDHTSEYCPARLWGACRGQGSMTRVDEDEWADHYRRYHGLTRDQFYGGDVP